MRPVETETLGRVLALLIEEGPKTIREISVALSLELYRAQDTVYALEKNKKVCMIPGVAGRKENKYTLKSD